jgi:phenylacetate-coenzyme A ligase PaaK-like adenylate-forming protein
MSTESNPLDSWIAGKIGLGQASLNRAALADWQIDRLRQTVDWVRNNSAFYRDHLSTLSDKPLTSLDDIHAFPFTRAEDIATDPLRFVCLSQSDISRVVTLDSSGTTSAPKRLFFSREDQEITLDFFDHGLRLMAEAGDKVMILLPGDKPGSVGDLLFQAIPRFGGIPVLAGVPHDFAACALLAAREAVTVIIGIPVQVLAIARHWRAMGWRCDHIRNVLLCSDNVSDAIRREISALWSCGIFQEWGMTELGYGGGVDCSAHCGYHLQESDFLFEIVDLDSGRPLPPGQIGEIVVTTLTRRGMPLIRYKTGDLSRFLDGPCACGSPLRRLDRIQTRKTGLLPVGDGQISMASLDEILFAIPDIADFTASLCQDGQPPVLHIKACMANDRAFDALSRRTAIQSALDTLSPLRAARESGLLRIEVDVLAERIPFGRRKRAITREKTS